jgi:transposase
MLDFLIHAPTPLDQQVPELDGELAALHKANPVSQLLAAIPGVGPLGPITIALTIEPSGHPSCPIRGDY